MGYQEIERQKWWGIAFSGSLWLISSFALFVLGVKFLIVAESENWIKALVLFGALAIGILKGSKILKKAAFRLIHHIEKQTDPLSLRNLFPPKYPFLILGMMALGLSFSWLGLPTLVRGGIDLAISFALFVGAYFFIVHLFGIRGISPNLMGTVELLEKNKPSDLMRKSERRKR